MICRNNSKTEFDEFRHHRGATSYHQNDVKVILYAYTSVFSGRKIEKLLNDSIRMMWLSQNQNLLIKRLIDLESIKSRCFIRIIIYSIS